MTNTLTMKYIKNPKIIIINKIGIYKIKNSKLDNNQI